MADPDAAIAVPDRTRRATYGERLNRRAADAALALCAGIDPSPTALQLLDAPRSTAPGRPGRIAAASAIERFAGLVIESVRDHAVAVKPQVAWFESHGASGMRALERTVEFARTAGLLVVLDAKRGDVPHTAAAYADAWLGDAAASGIGGDALTVNAAIGADSLLSMAKIAAQRHCALYALLHTSNPGAARLQRAALADGTAWWQLLAADIADVDTQVGGGVVGAVVGATHPELLADVRRALPTTGLLLPGIGTQGGTPEDLRDLARTTTETPSTLVVAARSLLPEQRCDTQGFRFAVDRAAAELSGRLAGVCAREDVG